MFRYIVVACITSLLVPLVQSDRPEKENHGNLRTHKASSQTPTGVKHERGDDDSARMVKRKRGDDELEGYLACVDVETGQRMIIQAADKMFWDYYLLLFSLTAAGLGGNEAPRSLKWKCKAFSPPQSNKAASFSSLPGMPSNVTEVIRSFEPRAVITCSDECRSVPFGMDHFKECSSATTLSEFKAVQESVLAKGGDCKFPNKGGMFLGATRSLEDCMKKIPFLLLKGRRFFNRCMVIPSDEALMIEDAEEKKIAYAQSDIADIRRNGELNAFVVAGLKTEVELINAEEEKIANAQRLIADTRWNRELDDHVFAGLSPMS